MPSAIKLRDYQLDVANRIHTAWLRVRSVLCVLPTGAGKTVVFSSVLAEHEGCSAAVVHRKEIVGQISQSLARLGLKHRVIAPAPVRKRIRRRHLKEFGKSFIDPAAQAGVASVQTITSRASGRNRELQAWISQVTLAVFDEGHHYVAKGLWGRAVDALHRAKLLFVTATPERADGKGLGADADGYAQEMVEGPSMRWLIDEGYLSPYKYRAPESDLDVSDIPVTASGDLNMNAMRARVVDSHLVGDVVKQYRQFADGKRAIVFATDVQTAEDMAAAFSRAGIPAAALSGETDAAERDQALDDFEAGRLLVLINVDLFDEGFDVPGVDAVIMARPTESLAKYLQMVGRALRPVYAPGYDLSTREGRLAAIAAGPKPFAEIIDPVSNWERHGAPTWPRRWTLEGREKGARSGGSGTVPQRVCEECTQPYERFYDHCPYCGAPAPAPAGRRAPEQVDGDLLELDMDALDALFESMRRADMPDDEYELTQFARNMPRVGRGADMKRHRANKYRRKVLRELVAWWVGCQPPDRPLGEVHRRFFHRFGVDIGTAFTLKAADTDALIDTIKKRFSEDLAA